MSVGFIGQTETRRSRAERERASQGQAEQHCTFLSFYFLLLSCFLFVFLKAEIREGSVLLRIGVDVREP